MVWKKLSLYWRDDVTTHCEICSANEGKFILVVDLTYDSENVRSSEREEYYCLSCFKDLIRP